VWVGSAGSMTAFGVIRSLRERWPALPVVAADTNPRRLVAAAADADAFVRVPPAADPGFLDVLREGMERWQLDTFVPIHDAEIAVAASAAGDGRLPRGVVTTAPALAAVEACSDKLVTARLLSAAGVPVPRTVRGDTAPEWEGPSVAKPRNGVGSRGVRLLRDATERTALESSEAFVLQAACVAPEITVDAFRSARDGWFAAVCRERIEVRAGIATRARVHVDPDLAELAQRAAVALGLTGSFCLQAMQDRNGEGWRVTDVNPRPGGATRMSVAAGMDFHAAALADAWGEDPMPYLPALERPRWVARGYVERVLDDEVEPEGFAR
jgi:carbamoyl-phosphate synthase large subunit